MNPERPPTRAAASPLPKARSAHFAISRAEGTVVVTVHGDLDVPGATHLGSALGDIIDGQGNLAVVVDLQHVSAAHASVLPVFAAAAKQASKHGGALSLSDPPALLDQELALMGLDRLVRTTRRRDGRPLPPLARLSDRIAPRPGTVHQAGQSQPRTRLQGAVSNDHV